MAWNRRPSLAGAGRANAPPHAREIEDEVFEFSSHRCFCCNHRYVWHERPGRADAHTIGDVEIDEF